MRLEWSRLFEGSWMKARHAGLFRTDRRGGEGARLDKAVVYWDRIRSTSAQACTARTCFFSACAALCSRLAFSLQPARSLFLAAGAAASGAAAAAGSMGVSMKALAMGWQCLSMCVEGVEWRLVSCELDAHNQFDAAAHGAHRIAASDRAIKQPRRAGMCVCVCWVVGAGVRRRTTSP